MVKAPEKSTDSEKQASQGDDLVSAIRGELIDVVPRRQVDALSERISQIVVSEYYSGPLPHPRHLAQYDSLIPDGAHRVMAMAEDALAHNHSMQAKLVDCEVGDRKRGMWMGFASFAALILCALLVMLITGSEVGAGLFLAAAAVNVIGIFINGRRK